MMVWDSGSGVSTHRRAIPMARPAAVSESFRCPSAGKASASTYPATSSSTQAVLGRARVQREGDAEAAALARRALHSDRAAVRLHQLPHERQPQPEPLRLQRAGLRAAVELLEDPRLHVWCHPDAGVLDRDP